uniref:Uncharacterized protein n=1 Tax=Branchiostoma floridae TaxID=7739 RepID=C3ZUN7_BRAFL|eukprot:XP_002587738.1 hypothetical protein BRAFLDRAFT_94641 [Branchiostoma floridae]
MDDFDPTEAVLLRPGGSTLCMDYKRFAQVVDNKASSRRKLSRHRLQGVRLPGQQQAPQQAFSKQPGVQQAPHPGLLLAQQLGLPQASQQLGPRPFILHQLNVALLTFVSFTMTEACNRFFENLKTQAKYLLQGGRNRSVKRKKRTSRRDRHEGHEFKYLLVLEDIASSTTNLWPLRTTGLDEIRNIFGQGIWITKNRFMEGQHNQEVTRRITQAIKDGDVTYSDRAIRKACRSIQYNIRRVEKREREGKTAADADKTKRGYTVEHAAVTALTESSLTKSVNNIASLTPKEEENKQERPSRPSDMNPFLSLLVDELLELDKGVMMYDGYRKELALSWTLPAMKEMSWQFVFPARRLGYERRLAVFEERLLTTRGFTDMMDLAEEAMVGVRHER